MSIDNKICDKCKINQVTSEILSVCESCLKEYKKATKKKYMQIWRNQKESCNMCLGTYKKNNRQKHLQTNEHNYYKTLHDDLLPDKKIVYTSLIKQLNDLISDKSSYYHNDEKKLKLNMNMDD